MYHFSYFYFYRRVPKRLITQTLGALAIDTDFGISNNEECCNSSFIFAFQ